MPAPASERVTAEEIEALVGSGRFGDAFRRFRSDESVRHESSQVELAVATAAARTGEYRHAVALASSALARFAKECNSTGQMRAFNLLGGVAFEEGRLDQADTFFQDAQRLAVCDGDEHARAKVLNNRAMIAHLKGRAYLAVEHWRAALLLYEAGQNLRGIVQTHHNLGLAYRELGLFHMSRHHNARASALVDRVSDPALEGVIVLGVAELAWVQGELTVAAEMVAQASALAEAAEDPSGQIAVARLRALMLLAAGDHAPACAEALSARESAERLGAALLTAECGVIQALAMAAGGERVDAERLFAQSLESLEQAGAARLQAWAEGEWARVSAVIP